MVAAGPAGGVLGDRRGTRQAAVLGAAVTAAGVLLLVPVGADWHPSDLSWRLAVVGAGIGLLAGPIFARLMSSAPPDLQGTAGAAQSLARQLGFSLGPAVATTTWALSDHTLPGLRAAFVLSAAAALTTLLVLCLRSAR